MRWPRERGKKKDIALTKYKIKRISIIQEECRKSTGEHRRIHRDEENYWEKL